MSPFDDAISALLSGACADELESDVLEFKQEPESPRRCLELIADTVVCLANNLGGTLIVGISDIARGSAAILGITDELVPDVVSKGVFDRTQPSLSVPVSLREVEGRRVLDITVPRGATFYANAKGTSTRRVGTSCVPFPPDEQRQAMSSRGLYDWSADMTTVSAVDEEEVSRLRRLLRAAGRASLADQPIPAILRDLRLTGAHGELTRAGVLLVGRAEDIESSVPTYGYSYQYRTTPETEATARFRGQVPLLAAVELLLQTVEARKSVRPLNITGGVQLTLQDYPPDAVRELVVNALVHRDYETPGSVDIEQSAESLRILSPGGLVFGVTVDNILSHPSTPRNRLLLETVTALQLAERTGQGVDRAYRVLLRNGKKPPAFVDSGTTVEAAVPGGAGDGSFARYVNTSLSDPLASDIEVLLILDHLCAHRTVGAAAAAALVQRSNSGAQSALERMAAAGLIEPSRRTASKPFPNYALSTAALTGLGLAVSYHRRAADGMDDKVTEHLREYGFITNQTIRRLFDIELFPARDMLKDLQTRGVVVKENEAARGPGVRYVRGPAFPK